MKQPKSRSRSESHSRSTSSSDHPLHRLYRAFLLALPPILFFSYYPIFSLGSDQSMNFELSLPLIWLILFGLLGVTIYFQSKPNPSFAKLWPWLPLPVFLTLSVVWSPNHLRGFLTAGILWLIYLAIFNFFTLKKVIYFPDRFARNFWRIFFASSLLVCIWCWLQCILDLAGLPQSTTLMCNGCIAYMFGFPHPNGFAIEPQFMGNLLLAPTLFSAYFTYVSSSQPTSGFTSNSLDLRHPRLFYPLIFFVLASTLFLTFSRGAIYAFLIGLCILTLWHVVQAKTVKPLATWLIVFFAFLFTLNAQGIMSALGPTSDTYQTGVAKVIHQLSLGLIDFRQPIEQPSTQPTSATPLLKVADAPSEQGTTKIIRPDPRTPDSISQNYTTITSASSPNSVFDGYVSESTDTRLNLTASALEIWRSSPRTILVGVGLGGAGQALYSAGKTASPKEIVQNQYASLLLETGLLGCALALWTLFLIFHALNHLLPPNHLLSRNSTSSQKTASSRTSQKVISPRPPSPSSLRAPLSSLRAPLFSLLAAYAFSLCFFTGLPNALHIYLLPPLLLLVATSI